MAVSRLSIAYRCLTPVLAASLLAGVSLDAAAAGGRGVIKLRLSNDTGPNRFEWLDTKGLTHYQEFSIQAGTKCIVDDDGWKNWVGAGSATPGPPSLVEVQADRPGGPVGANSGVGLLAGSLGVYDSTKGVSCGRMTDFGEGLKLTSKVGAFDKLELDMETKGSAVFELQVDPDADGKKYMLYTGANRQFAQPGDATCTGATDSGPDAGTKDNCRWTIEDVGTSFSIRPVRQTTTTNNVAGEGSLEGGGDYVAAGMVGDFSTKIYLSSTVDVGSLGCLITNNRTAEVYSDNKNSPAAACQVTRLNTNNIKAGSCTGEIQYKLETLTTDNLCQLDKTGGVKDQLAGSLQVSFNPEPRTDWLVSQTEITFLGQVLGINGLPLAANRCGGTVVDDALSTAELKFRTIRQVSETTGGGTTGTLLRTALKGKLVPNGDVDASGNLLKDFVADANGDVYLSDANDEVPGNGYIDWACVLDSTERYIGDGADGEEQQVDQTILFWGDIGWSRF